MNDQLVALSLALGAFHAGEPNAPERLLELLKTFDPASFMTVRSHELSPPPQAVRAFIVAALLIGDQADVTLLSQTLFRRCRFVFRSETLSPSGVRIEFATGLAWLHVSRSIEDARFSFVAARLAEMMPFFGMAAGVVTANGVVDVDPSDAGDHRALSFSQTAGGPLIPDCHFLVSDGYALERAAFADAPPFAQRDARLFWRGSTTGHRTAGWRSLPRVRLCQIARDAPNRDTFDVGITRIVQQESTSSLLKYMSSGHRRLRHGNDVIGCTRGNRVRHEDPI